MCLHESEMCVSCKEAERVEGEVNLGITLQEFRNKFGPESTPPKPPRKFRHRWSTSWFEMPPEHEVTLERVKTESIPASLEALLPKKQVADGRPTPANEAAPLSRYVEAARHATQADLLWNNIEEKRRQEAVI